MTISANAHLASRGLMIMFPAVICFSGASRAGAEVTVVVPHFTTATPMSIQTNRNNQVAIGYTDATTTHFLVAGNGIATPQLVNLPANRTTGGCVFSNWGMAITSTGYGYIDLYVAPMGATSFTYAGHNATQISAVCLSDDGTAYWLARESAQTNLNELLTWNSATGVSSLPLPPDLNNLSGYARNLALVDPGDANGSLMLFYQANFKSRVGRFDGNAWTAYTLPSFVDQLNGVSRSGRFGYVNYDAGSDGTYYNLNLAVGSTVSVLSDVTDTSRQPHGERYFVQSFSDDGTMLTVLTPPIGGGTAPTVTLTMTDGSALNLHSYMPTGDTEPGNPQDRMNHSGQVLLEYQNPDNSLYSYFLYDRNGGLKLFAGDIARALKPTLADDGSMYFYTMDTLGYSLVTATAGPLPEPTSVAFLGLGAWALLRRRRH
jgi:hypothetical protein